MKVHDAEMGLIDGKERARPPISLGRCVAMKVETVAAQAVATEAMADTTRTIFAGEIGDDLPDSITCCSTPRMAVTYRRRRVFSRSVPG